MEGAGEKQWCQNGAQGVQCERDDKMERDEEKDSSAVVDMMRVAAPPLLPDICPPDVKNISVLLTNKTSNDSAASSSLQESATVVPKRAPCDAARTSGGKAGEGEVAVVVYDALQALSSLAGSTGVMTPVDDAWLESLVSAQQKSTPSSCSSSSTSQRPLQNSISANKIELGNPNGSAPLLNLSAALAHAAVAASAAMGSSGAMNGRLSSHPCQEPSSFDSPVKSGRESSSTHTLPPALAVQQARGVSLPTNSILEQAVQQARETARAKATAEAARGYAKAVANKQVTAAGVVVTGLASASAFESARCHHDRVESTCKESRAEQLHQLQRLAAALQKKAAQSVGGGNGAGAALGAATGKFTGKFRGDRNNSDNSGQPRGTLPLPETTDLHDGWYCSALLHVLLPILAGRECRTREIEIDAIYADRPINPSVAESGGPVVRAAESDPDGSKVSGGDNQQISSHVHRGFHGAPSPWTQRLEDLRAQALASAHPHGVNQVLQGTTEDPYCALPLCVCVTRKSPRKDTDCVSRRTRRRAACSDPSASALPGHKIWGVTKALDRRHIRSADMREQNARASCVGPRPKQQCAQAASKIGGAARY